MILGAHISTKNGIDASPGRGKSIGCGAVQVFTKNQKRWNSRPLEPDTCSAFKKAVDENRIRFTAAHTSYLINLASSDPERLEKSRNAFFDEVFRAQQLGIDAVIFHPGSHLGEGVENGVQCAGEALAEAIETYPDYKVELLVETTAGQGTGIGHTFEQIRGILDAAGGGPRLGVCYDTCHMFAAGYDIRTKGVYNETFEQFDRTVGLELLKAFHLNDSKKELGSHVDRHEHIGKGCIGPDGFGFLMNDKRFADTPGYLETPQGEERYEENLKVLNELKRRRRKYP